MINEKISSEKILLAAIVLVALGLLVYFVMPKNSSPIAVQPTVSPTVAPTVTPTPILTLTPTPTAIPTPTPNIDISNWKIYRNDKYGFELKYPKEYESNKNYAIWTLNNEGDILSEWGVNKGQETIFGIDVYAKANKTKELDYYGKEVAGADTVINNIVVKKLDGGKSSWNNLMIENDKYIYIIISSFFPSNDISQYNEYEAILSTFKFIK